jgi:hypothetical protein
LAKILACGDLEAAPVVVAAAVAAAILSSKENPKTLIKEVEGI